MGPPAFKPASFRGVVSFSVFHSLPISPSQDSGKVQGKSGLYLWGQREDLDPPAGLWSCWLRSLALLVSGHLPQSPVTSTCPSGPHGLVA